MAYNIGSNTGNFQFTQSISKVLKNVENTFSNIIKEATLEVSRDTLSRLRNESATEQITPRDIYRSLYSKDKQSKPRLEDTWTMRQRHSKSSVNFEFRNRTPWASLIYSSQESIGHDNGFRSAYKHEENTRLYSNGKLLVLPMRPNQLTDIKWKRFISSRKSAMTKALNKRLKGLKL